MSSAFSRHKSGLLAERAGAAAVVVPGVWTIDGQVPAARYRGRCRGRVVVASNDDKLGDERFTDELRERVATPGDAFNETHRSARSLVKVGGDVDLAERGRITSA